MVSKKYRFLLIGLGILGSILYLVISGIQAEGVPYTRVGKLLDGSSTEPRAVKITATVKSGTLRYQSQIPLLRFSAVGENSRESITVVYEGIKPDALRESGPVILRGTYYPGKKTLEASSLLAKCPSRYKSKYKSYETKKTSS